MANLFQLLSNVKNKISNLGGAQGLTPYERLFGQQAPSSDDVEPNELLKGVDTSSPYYKESMGEEAPLVNITASQNPRVGGIFNDIVNGYRENRTTPISMNNFGDNNIDFNRTKGLSYRIGEGLGSIARVADSPLGRGLLTGAAVAALGGAPGEALAYGGTATALNQGNRMRDRVYRQQLITSAQDALRNRQDWNALTDEEKANILSSVQADNANFNMLSDEQKTRLINQAQQQYLANRQSELLSNIENQVNSIRGYVNDDTYKNLVAAQQMRDNAEYRNALLRSQQQAQQEAREDRKFEREMRREENAANRALTMRGQDLNYSLGRERLLSNNKQIKENRKIQENIRALNSIKSQLDRFSASFSDVRPTKAGALMADVVTKSGLGNTSEANFNAQRTLLFNKIARELGGEKGVLSDQDIKRIEEALPKLSDSLAQKKAKMQAIYNLLDDRLMQFGYVSNTQQDDNPLGLDL